jgi:hypothetical protein
LKKYPQILSEQQTIELAAQRSIARFGDGEWRCAVENGCTSQRADPALARELQLIALNPGSCIVCLPNIFNGCPRKEQWLRYAEDRYVKYCGATVYGSAFITRPDNAPWIDTPAYWDQVRALWRGKDVTLVVGDQKSLTVEMLHEAASVREIPGPRQHAYAVIDAIESQIGTPAGTVILCLGATATVLAYRLEKKGVHALDLGHIGMFMKHAGAYFYESNDLTSMQYRNQLTQLHRKRSWGADGEKHAEVVNAFAVSLHAETLLDYGCGEAKLAAALPAFKWQNYDPGVIAHQKMPKPADVVVCSDVLEHVEPDKLENVLDHLWRLSSRGAYFVISTKVALAVLPDGRNAHLIVESAEWWLTQLERIGWQRVGTEATAKELRVWLTKP